jgi:3-hydroxyisobutyrate dehydrogenase
MTTPDRPLRGAGEMPVAVLGIGSMGHALAERLLAHDHPVDVWNRSPGRTAALRDASAVAIDTPDDLAGACAAVFLCLADDASTLAVAAPDGRPRQGWDGIVVVNTGTVSPAAQDQLAAIYGSRFVAAPILGAPQAVRSGAATFVVAGPPDAVAALAPVWARFSGTVEAGDDHSRAAALKLLENQMLLSGLSVVAETIRLGRGIGLGDDFLIQMLAASPSVAPSLGNRLPALFDPDHPGWSSAPAAAKDLGLALGMDPTGDFPVTRAARDAYERIVDEGWGELDITAIVELDSGRRPPGTATPVRELLKPTKGS